MRKGQTSLQGMNPPQVIGHPGVIFNRLKDWGEVGLDAINRLENAACFDRCQLL
jgi:hypothetical protein